MTPTTTTALVERLREFLLDNAEMSDRQAAALWDYDPDDPKVAKQLAVRRHAFSEVLHWLNKADLRQQSADSVCPRCRLTHADALARPELERDRRYPKGPLV